MTSRATRRFWQLYQELPLHVQRLALKNYRIWLVNSRHPSLDFKKLAGQGGRFSFGSILSLGDSHRHGESFGGNSRIRSRDH